MTIRYHGNIKKAGCGIIAVLTVFALSAFAREKVVEKIDKTEKLAVNGKVFLGNISGDIAIKAWDKEEVRIEAVKTSTAASAEKAKENAGRVSVDISRDGEELRIEAKYPEGKKHWGDDSLNVSVDFRLWIPAKASIKVKSVSGDAAFDHIGGAVETALVSGGIVLQDTTGAVNLHTVSGDLRIEDAKGDVTLKTVSGDILMKGIRGSIEAETVSGDVEMKDIGGASSVKAKSLSGDAVFTGVLEPQGRYAFKSHSGDIKILLPADSSFEFEAETFSGVIDSEFQIGASGKASSRELRGVVGKGGAVLSLSTFSGDIDLKKS